MFNKGRRLKANQQQELRVAAAILASSHDPRGKQLFEQLAAVDRQRRKERKDGFVVTVPATSQDLIDLDADVESAWVRVPEARSGQLLEFRVTLRRGGYFHSLEGRAVDGSWPSAWHVDEVAVGQAAVGALTLPG